MPEQTAGQALDRPAPDLLWCGTFGRQQSPVALLGLEHRRSGQKFAASHGVVPLLWTKIAISPSRGGPTPSRYRR